MQLYELLNLCTRAHDVGISALITEAVKKHAGKELATLNTATWSLSEVDRLRELYLHNPDLLTGQEVVKLRELGEI